MKPFLEYGWQPQVMAVEGSRKAILAGKLEVYDVTTRSGGSPQSGIGHEPGSSVPGASRGLSGAVTGGRACAGHAGRRGKAEARQPGIRQRRSGADRSQGCAAAGRHDQPVRRPRQGVRAVRRRRVRSRDPAAGADPRRGSLQPRCDAAARDRALVARARGRGPRGVQKGERAGAAVPGRPHLPRAALRARQGLGPSGAAPGAGRRRVTRARPRSRSARRRPRASGARAGSDRSASERSTSCARRRPRSWCSSVSSR